MARLQSISQGKKQKRIETIVELYWYQILAGVTAGSIITGGLIFFSYLSKSKKKEDIFMNEPQQKPMPNRPRLAVKVQQPVMPEPQPQQEYIMDSNPEGTIKQIAQLDNGNWQVVVEVMNVDDTLNLYIGRVKLVQ